jgi:hypothetical protein
VAPVVEVDHACRGRVGEAHMECHPPPSPSGGGRGVRTRLSPPLTPPTAAAEWTRCRSCRRSYGSPPCAALARPRPCRSC